MDQSHSQHASDSVAALVSAFNAAFNRQNIEAVMEWLTEDAVFENTYPPPDGARHAGQEAVRAAFEEFFRSSPHAVLETEALYTGPDHCTVRWLYRWGNPESANTVGHVRGIDVFEIRNGKISAKYSYVKG